jgi:exodeoxyribonuclease VII large subunit
MYHGVRQEEIFSFTEPTMSQLPLFTPPIWSITQLTLYIRDILESDPSLQDIWVQGEISNFSRPVSGHIYFTLKDSTSALKCVMWRNSVGRLNFSPRDGQSVEVHGSMNVFEAAGQYQLYADLIRPIGEGRLFQEFMKLKARLEAEGLFDLSRKRPIPDWPRQIGIITSATGAALRDILNTLRRRYTLAEVILAPTAVQGAEAPLGIVAALEALNHLEPPPDVILVARGGGSIEDLWAFNDERVARSIAASSAPIISGVGHETDFTITDFVADLRAPTPTAAAELATPDRIDLLAGLNEISQRLERGIQIYLTSQNRVLQSLTYRLKTNSPLAHVRSERQKLDDLVRHSDLSLLRSLQIRISQLNGFQGRLNSLNPMAVLNRGYALVSHPDGRLVRSVSQVHPVDLLEIRLHDGKVTAQASKIHPLRDQ